MLVTCSTSYFRMSCEYNILKTYKKLFLKFSQICLPIPFVPGSLTAGCRILLRSAKHICLARTFNIKKSQIKICIQTPFQSTQPGDTCCIIPLNPLTPNAPLSQLFVHNQLILLQRLLECCLFTIHPDQK